MALRGAEAAPGAAYPDRGLTIAAVGNHPLLAEPDVFQALGGGEVVLAPESPDGLHVRGGATDHVAYLLDGIPVLGPWHSAGVGSAWNPDAIARVDLLAAAPSPALPHALSGTVAARTRPTPPGVGMRGALSTAQARITLDGPAGASAGWLLSARRSMPGVFAPDAEPSYLRGGGGDWLARLESPMLGGRLRLLGFLADDDLNVSAAPTGQPGTPRNRFEWRSRSFGAEWQRGGARLLAWAASGSADAGWHDPDAPATLASSRDDLGALASAEWRLAGAPVTAGLRIERVATSYRAEAVSEGLGAENDLVIATAFGEQLRPLGERTTLRYGASLATGEGGVRAGPLVELRWRMSDRTELSASAARTHQFAQSLRNAESVVGAIFPADLWLAAGPGVPVARSDQGVLAASWRPSAAVRVGVQAWARRFDHLLLVAPGEGGPFATGGFSEGEGTARGISADASVATARFAALASYALQHVRFEEGGAGYVPGHGTGHLLEGGIIVFPAATLSVRLGAVAMFGRRTTALSGPFEWEACNLIDQGCEFGGSPNNDGERIGGVDPPMYARLDLSVRKHFHMAMGRRDAVVSLYGTVSNLLGRANVLTYARDPGTDRLVPVVMRPIGPLVMGLEWRF
jgi:hypothetical protein